MMGKYTPGPWVIGPYKRGYVDIDGKDWEGLASVVVRMEYERTNSIAGDANATLISLAPEMEEALRDIVNAIDYALMITPGRQHESLQTAHKSMLRFKEIVESARAILAKLEAE